ncbi:MAG TPA: zinc-dependent metalloprotease [Vicinamibacteria bacterium]|nr:zinc-dependent metalloprotease [Vicinamibacteria bacterium]
MMLVFLLQASIPSIEEETDGMQHLEGFFDVYWDEATGHLYWEIDKLDTEFLYQVSLSSGLGSNPVGLDRGQLGSTAILKAMRVGPRVLLIEPNYRYRARSDNPDEVRAVEDAFAPSVHWGFDVAAETPGRLLVDATDFFLRDTHGVAAQMESAGQGSFQLEKSRSAFFMPRTKAFPGNTEIETLLTFTSAKPGPLVRSVAASGEAVTLRQHHSLVELPDRNYEPLAADPRIGVFGPEFYDYATPIDESLIVRWVARHRLEKKDPAAARSEPVEPIVYYLDRGAPEPVRSALLEGARWWNQAFEAAGFIDAFRVEVLPEGADPMDIRYNMIHWTHRSTRGWSYGDTVTDPRTGEIIKGNVNLGSLRLRQDYLMGKGMTPPFTDDGGGLSGCGLAEAPGFTYLAQASPGASPVDMALARVRQLSAHEVGHTLGFPHNYLASTYGGRASVMDYPAPLVHIRDGKLDLSDAYAVGIGDYDKLAVRWLYADFPAGTDEAAALAAIVEEGLRNEVRFMAHTDNLIAAGAHPLASVWDNGANLVDMLDHEIEVRRIALASFGPEAIRVGEPMSLLEQVLVPLYLHHRYQLKAAMNTLGGADYYYALRGDGQTPITIVPGEQQRKALAAALETLTPEFLAIPERVLNLIPPPAYRYDEGETFPRRTGLVFDPLTAAQTSADYTVSLMLHPERMARLVDFGSRDESYLGLDEVAERLVEATWMAPRAATSYLRQVQEVAERSVLDGLLGQASSAENPTRVRAVLSERLYRLAESIEAESDPSAHRKLAAEDIRRWQNRPEGTLPRPEAPEIPPGSPIGSRGRQ